MRETRSTCPYCGTGCGVIIESEGEAIVGVRGDPSHPANAGKLCTKGATLHRTAERPIQLQTRLLYPQLRKGRGGEWFRTTWEDTLDLLAERFASTLLRHGPDSVGFYLSGQLLTEDYYVFNKLVKGLIGTNNVDTNSRLCMSSAVAGYKQTLGADAPPACYEDIDHAQCLFIAGSNTAWAHPILFRRIEAAKARNPALRIIVADPRRTDTAQSADLFLPLQPGTDVALFQAMLHVILSEGLADADYIARHTEGFSELRAAIEDCTPAWAAGLCGLPAADIVTAARWFGQSGATLSLYCQGLNQSASGTAKNAALINLHLATGQIGKPGAGPFSLTGQPNAMGGREVGGLANLLSAHRDLANPEHRAEVARLWGVPHVPARPGKTAVEMFEAARTGEIKLLWIVCTNPAQSLPNQRLVREALERAELVIVQDAYRGIATADHADVLLPAATWGEKDGTVTNSERRISRQRAAVAPLGEARPDWRIAVDFARRLEARLRPGRPTLFPYDGPEAVWKEHRETTRGRDLDITGLSYARLEADGPQCWPFPEGASAGKTRLYEDGRFPTPTGRARFASVAYRPVAEPVDARYPLALTTGRLRDHWHGMSRTGTVAQLFSHEPEPALEMHAGDMAHRGLADGDLVHLTSRRGSQIVPVRAQPGLRPGLAHLAMHWGEEYLSGGGSDGSGGRGVNALTSSALDPISRQPELKHAAVKALKAELPWRYLAFAWLPKEEILGRQAGLRPLLKRFAFAATVLFGRERCGLMLRAAHDYPAEAPVLAEIEALMELAGPDVLRYDDKRRGTARRVRVAEGALAGVALSGDVAAGAWLKPYLEEGQSVAALGRLLLLPSPQAPTGFKSRGRVVCNCLNVAEASIVEALACVTGTGAEALAALQLRLKCGTQCGSCVPELKRLVAGARQAA